jgi:glycosyltransferase involved in cell wall biosynthesis
VRVALVHDWLTGMRGGERVLEELVGLYPDAEIYTLVHVPGSTSEALDRRPITQSPLGRLPGAGRHYRKLLPLLPWAARSLRVGHADLVVSVSHAVAKAVSIEADVPHVCYCLTPMRYVWDQTDAYLGRGAARLLASPLIAQLRRFDRQTSTPDRVHRFVGASRTVCDRIRRHYGRDAALVYPPVDVDGISPDGRPPGDFYLLVGAFVPYKREELAIEAFRGLPARLRVVGDGPLRRRLERNAPSNVEFLGWVGDEQLRTLYARCRALVYPQEEDFGIAAVEAQAAGRPVIAFARGGATETVIPLRDEPGGADPTGVWFDEPTAEGLREALLRFEKNSDRFLPGIARLNAKRFSRHHFRSEFSSVVEELLASRRSGTSSAPPRAVGAS